MGTGVFASKNELQVKDESGKETERIKAKHFIIATGARPRVLPNLPIDGKMIVDSEAAMTMEKQPKKIIFAYAQLPFLQLVKWARVSKNSSSNKSD